MTTHFRTNEALAEQYDARCKTDVATAVSLVLATLHSIDVGDVPAPHLTTLASLTLHDRTAYALEHAAAIARERRAIALVRNAAHVRAQHAEHVSNRTADERAAFIGARVAQLETEHHAKLRAGWLATAEAEAAAKFDAPTPVTEPDQPARAAKRRSA